MAKKENNVNSAFRKGQAEQIPVEEQYRDAARRGMIPRPVRMVRGDEELAPGTSPMQPGGAPYLVRDGAGMPRPEKDEPETVSGTGEAPRDEVIEEVVLPRKKAIGRDEVREAMKTLRKYKDGKRALEEKIVKNEKWWKLRHWDLVKDPSSIDDPRPASGWLFNCIISKVIIKWFRIAAKAEINTLYYAGFAGIRSSLNNIQPWTKVDYRIGFSAAFSDNLSNIKFSHHYLLNDCTAIMFISFKIAESLFLSYLLCTVFAISKY